MSNSILQPPGLPGLGDQVRIPVGDVNNDGWLDLLGFAVEYEWPDGHLGSSFVTYGPGFDSYTVYGDRVIEDKLAHGAVLAPEDMKVGLRFWREVGALGDKKVERRVQAAKEGAARKGEVVDGREEDQQHDGDAPSRGTDP